jgi:Flp pilus assembly protein CpaB
MAKAKDMQWLPSGGVLFVAIGAALVAAILINVYINVVRSEYEAGAKTVLQMAEEVEKDTPLQPRHLKTVMVPKPFIPALKQAVDVKDKDAMILGKRAPRHMYAGEFLFYPDFVAGPPQLLADSIPQGFSLVTIPISTEGGGSQLQPGSFVSIYGEFNVGGDPRRPDVQVLPVIENVRVKLVGGLAVVEKENRSYNDISILVRQALVPQVLQIQRAMGSRSRFTVVQVPRSETAAEAVINRQVLDLVEKGKPPAPALVPGG